MKVISLPVQLSNRHSLANLVVSIIVSARCPSDSVVRVSDCYSKDLWFESLLDPLFFFMDLFLTFLQVSSTAAIACIYLLQINTGCIEDEAQPQQDKIGAHDAFLWYFSSLSIAPDGPPLNLAVQSVNSTSLTLSWKLPSLPHQDGATLNYTLTCIPPAESGIPPVISVFTTSGAHTLNGLTPATLYSCSVFATNVYGNGPPVNISAMTEDGGMFILLCDFVMYLSIKPAYIATF